MKRSVFTLLSCCLFAAQHFAFSEDPSVLSESCKSGVKKSISECQEESNLVSRFNNENFPEKIKSILREDWNALDPNGTDMVSYQRTGKKSFTQFAHARDTFHKHLLGTFSILGAWDQPIPVMRTGLFHTAYSGDLFQFYIFNAAEENERQELRSVIGEEAEQLTFYFGTVNRSFLNETIQGLGEGETLKGENYIVSHRLNQTGGIGTVSMSPKQIADILMVTIADYLDQMVEVNGWRDHHQVERPLMLYPGDMRPTIAFHWFSKTCNAIRPYLDVVPNIFNKCEDILSYDDEVAARDAYWSVIVGEHSMTEESQLQQLELATKLNPYIGEPWLMKAEIHFRQEKWAEAVESANQALDRFLTLAAAWDKRLRFEAWLSYTRLLRLRANRKSQGLAHLPFAEQEEGKYKGKMSTTFGLPLVSLEEIVDQL